MSLWLMCPDAISLWEAPSETVWWTHLKPAAFSHGEDGQTLGFQPFCSLPALGFFLPGRCRERYCLCVSLCYAAFASLRGAVFPSSGA